MIDLHSHILPGVDDGAKDASVALAMLEIAVSDGIKGMVATPHVDKAVWLPQWQEIVDSCTALAAEARRAGLSIELFPGAEVAVQPDNLDLLIGPGPYCINGGRYILVELPALQIPSYTDEFFFVLQTRGLFPILAHPERNLEIARKPEVLRNWIAKGLLLQVNATSITGQMGRRAKGFANWLLQQDMVHCISSDAHGIRSRRPLLTEALASVASQVGVERAGQIAVNSAKIVSGEEIDVPEPCGSEQQSGRMIKWLSKLMPG